MDLFLAMVSSTIVLLLLSFFTSSDYYKGTFAIWWLGGALVTNIIMMVLFKCNRVIVRHATLVDMRRAAISLLCSKLLMAALILSCCVANSSVIIALVMDYLLTFALYMGVRFFMFEIYANYKAKLKDSYNRQRILVYGTSDKAMAAVTRLQNSKHYNLVGFISQESNDKTLKLTNYPVYSFKNAEDFKSIVDNISLAAVFFPRDSDVKSEENSLVKYCAECNVKTLIIPTIDEVVGGKVMKSDIRQVRIEDLLGREEIKISMDEIRNNFEGKVVMVTGAAGSIGSELCRQLATFDVKKLVLYDNAETPMHNIRLELEERFPNLVFVPVIGSVCNKQRLHNIFRLHRPQVVFHAAAYKHVPLMEENPCEAVITNVMGTRLVAEKCVEYNVEMMVMISTDKAVNPTNIMGCSKRLAEIYVQSLGLAISGGSVKGNTKFVTTRFGNVLGSNGSVIPRFKEQIEKGGPVTVTHPEITRFFMTIPEACRLVMEAATMSSGNQIFVFDMGESVKIADLAKRMIELAGLRVGEDIEIQYTGLRPGEKLYEEVLANNENTIPTKHDRIRIAKVREYEFHSISNDIDELIELARNMEIPSVVKKMKAIVPEFKSHNSKFEEYDK